MHGRSFAFSLLRQVPLEAARNDVVHAGGIVTRGVAGNAVGAVGVLRGHAVLKDNHGRNHVRALHMRNVVALDAQQRVGQFQRLLQLHEGGAAGGQITGTAALVQGQRLARILGDRLHELCLVAALRDANLHGAAAHLRQP